MSNSARPALPLTAAEKEVIRLRAELKAANPQQQAAASSGSQYDAEPALGMIGGGTDSQALDLAAKRYQARNPGTDYIAAVKAVQAGG